MGPTLKKRIPRFFLWAAFVLCFPLGIWAKTSVVEDADPVLRDIQLLLSLKNIYRGPLDGICGQEITNALRQYGASLSKYQKGNFVASCDKANISQQTLPNARETITNDLRSNLLAGQPQADNPNTSEIEILKTDLKITRETLEKFSQTVSERFVTQFANLATIGIATILTSISIVGSFAWFLGKEIIKDEVKEKIDAASKDVLAKLQDYLRTSSQRVTYLIKADIFKDISGHNIYIYRNIANPTEKHGKDIYKSNVSVATLMAENGYYYSKKLKDITDAPSVHLDLTQDEKDKYNDTFEWALNNYVFYLSQRYHLRCRINDADGAYHDKKTLDPLLVELRNIVGRRQQAQEEDSDWWYFQDTVFWAELNLENASAEDTAKRVISLLNNPEVASEEWKEDVKLQYKLRDKFHYDEPTKCLNLDRTQSPDTPAGTSSGGELHTRCWQWLRRR